MVENGGRKGGRQGIDEMIMCCYQNELLGRLLEVKVWRGEGGGMPDHFLMEARLKFMGGWGSAGRMEGVRSVLKLSELNNSVKERAYQESLRVKSEVWRGRECRRSSGKSSEKQ